VPGMRGLLRQRLYQVQGMSRGHSFTGSLASTDAFLARDLCGGPLEVLGMTMGRDEASGSPPPREETGVSDGALPLVIEVAHQPLQLPEALPVELVQGDPVAPAGGPSHLGPEPLDQLAAFVLAGRHDQASGAKRAATSCSPAAVR